MVSNAVFIFLVSVLFPLVTSIALKFGSSPVSFSLASDSHINFHINLETPSTIQLDLSVFTGETLLYASNSIQPSDAFYCGNILSSTAGHILLDTSSMHSYGDNSTLLITVLANAMATTSSLSASIIDLQGNVSIF